MDIAGGIVSTNMFEPVMFSCVTFIGIVRLFSMPMLNVAYFSIARLLGTDKVALISLVEFVTIKLSVSFKISTSCVAMVSFTASRTVILSPILAYEALFTLVLVTDRICISKDTRSFTITFRVIVGPALPAKSDSAV